MTAILYKFRRPWEDELDVKTMRLKKALLKEILNRLGVPELRKDISQQENLMWLQQNLPTNYGDHPLTESALKVVGELHTRLLDETEEYEKDNFLFQSAGDGYIIKGMRYPDTAFSEDDGIPVIFKTSEERVLIAAFPQSLVNAILEMVTYEFKDDDLEDAWEKVLHGLSNSAEKKIENGEINDPF